jgi:hypothetical protein
VPVGAFVPEMVVVVLRIWLLVKEPLVARDDEAAMKTIEDDTVILVAL